jgi:hypothetical protein
MNLKMAAKDKDTGRVIYYRLHVLAKEKKHMCMSVGLLVICKQEAVIDRLPQDTAGRTHAAKGVGGAGARFFVRSLTHIRNPVDCKSGRASDSSV